MKGSVFVRPSASVKLYQVKRTDRTGVMVIRVIEAMATLNNVDKCFYINTVVFKHTYCTSNNSVQVHII